MAGSGSESATYVTRAADVDRAWWVVDAEGLTLGRLCTAIAVRLSGKHKPTYAPFLDCGDHVVVVNADRVRLSGRKLQTKVYRRHSGRPGGLKETPAARVISRHPERIIERAVRGMLPKGPLGRRMFRKLKVYAGPRHPHEAQRPQPLQVPGAVRKAQ